MLLTSARQEKIEDGSMVRLDSTVTAALMHEPSDSSLLWDAVRVMVRLLKQAQAWMGDIARAWCDHRRAAKRRWQAIAFTRGRPKRVPLYREGGVSQSMENGMPGRGAPAHASGSAGAAARGSGHRRRPAPDAAGCRPARQHRPGGRAGGGPHGPRGQASETG